ncbi:hypothetical protein SCLCIDRAFT_131196 [Scleroderma citrinum Foug A]|uniref:Uncharacterized protein n=1 Tax=Scleroderma citrinum Foug A TaxID=1036808 RepID=A0A0C3D8V6_9AGAM|nr:hypothetical protein SCLCIDRAFT_131196 [Scleroderma citrinum Foug A]
MSDPVGNLWYCYTPLASWIADTPEESLLSATSPKVSPVTTATSKEFGNLFRHPSCTATLTLTAICTACAMHDPSDYLKFLKVIWKLGLNGVIYPFFEGWPMSDPFDFFTLEVLHHFHQLFWDHDANWCILTVGAAEINFHFSLLQTTVSHRLFEDGISNLKQVTGRDHRTIQWYMVSVIASAVPRRFLIAIHSLVEFQYLTQAPSFTDNSLVKVSNALQEFHDHKNTIVHASTRKDNSWRIPKLELLQSIVPSIHLSGAVSQWSADVTKHNRPNTSLRLTAHVQEIKVPACSGNNQNYYSQIAHYLDRSEKCFHFDIATYLASFPSNQQDNNELSDQDEDHHPELESQDHSLTDQMVPT